METRSNHILVGGVVLTLVAATLAFIIWLAQVTGEDLKRYDIFFNQGVDGLNKGSAVAFSGVPVGQVESINLEPNTPQFIRVRITVRDDVPVLQGTTATVEGVGFTGVSQIQLEPPRTQPGDRRPPPIACPEENAESQCPYGVPLIATKPGGFAQLLNSAPELLERVTTLTERLTMLISDRNQASIAQILENVQEISRSLADRSPEIAATLADARVTLRQAGDAAEQFGKLANSTNSVIDQDGRALVADLRKTVQAAERSMENLDRVLQAAGPSFERLNKQTIPEANQLIRNLKDTSEALKSISNKIDQGGATSILGSPKLPEYEGR